MSETTTTESLDAGSTGSGSRRPLFLIGGLLALVVVAAAAYLLFFSGGSDEELGAVPSGAAPAQQQGGGDKQDKQDSKPKEADFSVTVGRDPFEPLAVEAEVQPPADTSGGGGGGSDTSTNGTDTSTTTTTTTTPTPTPAPTVDTQVTTYKVTLQSVDVAKDQATVQVDGKNYVVKVKDLFTSSKTGPFKLTWVGQRNGEDVAKVVFGSDAPVELTAGDTVRFEL